MDGADRVLLVKGTSKQAKNKYWGGYLFRIDDATGEGTRIEGEPENDTYIGIELPKLDENEHLQTSVYDPETGIVTGSARKGDQSGVCGCDRRISRTCRQNDGACRDQADDERRLNESERKARARLP